MKALKVCVAAICALYVLSTAIPARADSVKNIVLVHGAWVDASGWNAVYEILTTDGFNVTIEQEPETSLADDVAATKRIRSSGRSDTFADTLRWLGHHGGRHASERRRPCNDAAHAPMSEKTRWT